VVAADAMVMSAKDESSDAPVPAPARIVAQDSETPERPRPGVDLSVGAFNVGGAATGWLVGAFWHSDPTVSLSGQIGTDATAGHRAGWAGRFGRWWTMQCQLESTESRGTGEARPG